MNAADILEAGAKLYRERNALYGDNYLQFGNIMLTLFPDGLTIKTQEDWNRIGIFVQKISKLTRYTNNWGKGGHPDSVHDDMVYTAMLEEIDAIYNDARIDRGPKQPNEDKREPQGDGTERIHPLGFPI